MRAILLVLLLSGCTNMPKHVDMHKTHIAKPAPSEPATFKQRWYSKFKVHPKWFH